MPKRTDIKSVLIIGAGPIIIGQACEFDYSGTQACKALREEGYKIILVNSNPATIMTDPEMADVVYIEPINWKIVSKIIEKEHPDVILPTMGGQTALNCALDLENNGILKKFKVDLIGITSTAINNAENRCYFDKIIKTLGLQTSRSGIARNKNEALNILKYVGFPCIIRSSFTMGGSGSGIAYNKKEFDNICEKIFDSSSNIELLIDESLIGWKEYEMEIIRDQQDNCIIICSIENFDPMGIHTGDSITVAPAQTLSDKEYQIMRNASISILRAIGVKNGCSNVQFAINPKTGKLIVIEMNPRVSRSSALASKATGFPIAKIATKLAVGYTLDELINDITDGRTPASFEPTIDYIVTKIPRFNFEKFPGTNDRLTTQMKSVGEVMAIGRTQQESLQKALRGLDIGYNGLESKINCKNPESLKKIYYELENAGSERIWYIADAFRCNISVDTIFNLTYIDRWFLLQIKELVELEDYIINIGLKSLNIDYLKILKRKGFSDARLASLVNTSEKNIRILRQSYNLHPVYKRIDTCSAEFSTDTAYMYSTYEEECESKPNKKKKIIILGGGPNRIGQGIEFDYCCVHAALALREDNYEIIMVNCNPETVSTDYDMADRLYFEPITLEDILEIVYIEKPLGVIVQYGGQTPLKIAYNLEKSGVFIIGTNPKSIDIAENRKKFQHLAKKLNLKQPMNTTSHTLCDAIKKADKIGYPIIVRPSYVLGGRAMKIVYNNKDLINYFNNEIHLSNNYPVLLDKFLDSAIEVDVDAICDTKDVFIGGIMEHIEQAGVHSGDSACSLPVYSIHKNIQNIIRELVKKIAIELNVIGLINIQFAIKNNEVYIIEVNPRASRTVPFVSKAIGVALAKIAARVMVGKSLAEQGYKKEIIPSYFFVKEVVLPFNKFDNIDPMLGPEMRSTGEVMGIGYNFSEAFAKAMMSKNSYINKNGHALLSVQEKDKSKIVDLAKLLLQHGFKLDATSGTASILKNSGISVNIINKICQEKIHIKNLIKNIYNYIVITTSSNQTCEYSKQVRLIALQHKIHYDTTLNGAFASVMSLNANNTLQVTSIQEIHNKS